MDYRRINCEVMKDTCEQCKYDSELAAAVALSRQKQFVVVQEDNIDLTAAEVSNTRYIVSGKRSFEAARYYVGKKVAVLNFANSHSVGGAPFSAGAQEESLCRCSTLYPCLQALESEFYEKHRRQFETREIDFMGNDDLIYTPDVVVFKTDVLANPICPQMMAQRDWYKVNVITSAAPELHKTGGRRPSDYEARITSRIRKILDVAAKERNEVLILGAWGCGAFQNPTDVVADVFYKLLKNYNFETVEFALSSNKDVGDTPFATRLSPSDNIRNKIIALLQSTGREHIDKVISWLDANNFYDAPASASHHNNVRGGLAKHSLEVYHEAIRLNETYGLPVAGVTLCALLHDVCKSDQYYVDADGMAQKCGENAGKGHGRRSMFILKRRCELPMNYDEEMAVWWHMGEYEPSREWCPEEYRESQKIALCELIQKADRLAADKANR